MWSSISCASAGDTSVENVPRKLSNTGAIVAIVSPIAAARRHVATNHSVCARQVSAMTLAYMPSLRARRDFVVERIDARA